MKRLLAALAADKSPEFRRVFDASPAWKGCWLPDRYAAGATPAALVKPGAAGW